MTWETDMTTMNGKEYRYTECGLDNVYLVGGVDFVDHPSGRRVVIKDIDGLHALIGRTLIDRQKNLTGKEIRFLRQEMGMSQATLAKLLEVNEQAVARWEKGKTGVPKPAEALIRFLYREHSDKNKTGHTSIRECLRRLADLEDAIDGGKVTIRKTANKAWKVDAVAAAA